MMAATLRAVNEHSQLIEEIVWAEPAMAFSSRRHVGRLGHGVGLAVAERLEQTTQQARNLLLDLDEHVSRFRFLVRDRAGQFAASFDEVLADAGIEVVKDPTAVPAGKLLRRTPHIDRPQPNLPTQMLIFGERHLRRVLAIYAMRYNGQRPHRALQLRSPRPDAPVPKPVYDRIRRPRRPILGGLLNQYEPAA